jgi:hypothetical protein
MSSFYILIGSKEPRSPSYPSFEGCQLSGGSVPILIGAFWMAIGPR